MADALVGLELTSVAEHVQGCATCQNTLESWSADGELSRVLEFQHQSVLFHLKAVLQLPETEDRSNPPELLRVLQAARSNLTNQTGGEEKAVESAAPVTTLLGAPKRDGDLGSLGPYCIRRELGRGGMGVVLEGFDPELQRAVAIKLLFQERTDPVSRARFVREAQAAARIKHDHVVTVYSVANPSNGPAYLVMEYIAGQTLREFITGSGPLDPRQAAEIAAQVAAGLAAAHAAGLVHRDIKPSNILLSGVSGPLSAGSLRPLRNGVERSSTADQGRGTTDQHAKITDFGLARPVDRAAGHTVTRSGIIAGTPAYMSPEQILDSSRVDERSDVYSLGVTLYQSLTGEVPFRGAPHMVLRQIESDEPRPPHRLNDAVPRDLETMCLKAMAKEPARRYATAAELRDDLRRWLRGEPIRARPVGPGERAWRWCRRNPRVAGLSAALILVFLTGSGGMAWQWWRAERQLQETKRQQERAEAGYRQARRAVDEFYTEVSQNKLAAKPGMTALRKQLLTMALQFYQGFLEDRGDDPTLMPELAATYFRVAEINGMIGQQVESRAAADKARELFEQLVRAHPVTPEYQRDLATSYNWLCWLEDGAGHLDEAIRFLEQARVLWNRLAREHPDDLYWQSFVPKSDHWLGLMWTKVGREDEALRAYVRSRDRWVELLQRKPDELNFQDNMARLSVTIADLQLEREPAEALRAYKQACQIWETMSESIPLNPTTGMCLAVSIQGMGCALAALGQHSEAISVLSKARERLDRLVLDDPTVLGPQSYLSQTCCRLGEVYVAAESWPEATAALEKARAVAAGLVAAHEEMDECHQLLADALTNLGIAQLRAGTQQEALDNLQEAVVQQRRAVAMAPQRAANRKLLFTCYRNLARAEHELARPAEAADTAREWKELGPDDPVVLCDVARVLARCATLIDRRDLEPTPAQRSERQEYVSEAVESLKQAIAHGCNDLERLRQDPELATLRDVEAFRILVADKDKDPAAIGPTTESPL